VRLVTDDLNDILIFVKVVQSGSFTAAAKVLGVPKTTVSRKVKELEDRLRAQLIHRTTRRLGLTEAGTIYYRHCQSIAQTLADAEAAVTLLRGEPRGRLRITSSYSMMVSLVAPLLGEFHTLYPAVTVDLVLSHETLDLVKEEIDLALRMGPLPDSGMVARRLATLPNRVYASPAYLSAHGALQGPEDLAAHATLTTRVARRADGFAWSMHKDSPAEDYPINPIIVADDPEVLKAPLFAGAGLMLATDMIMRRHLKEELVVPVLSGWFGRSPDLHALFPRGNIQAPKLRAFIDFLVSRLDAAI
jgi:DNA-binding transcriptional LysR family regulator